MSRVLPLMFLVGCSGGFEVGSLERLAGITGRIVERDGHPVEGALVSLHAEAEPLVQGRSDAQGRFSLEVSLQDRLQLAVVADQGRGQLRGVQAVAGATQDVGDVQIDDLSLRPEILRLRGLGYEERVTQIDSVDGWLQAYSYDDARYWLFWSGRDPAGRPALKTALFTTEPEESVVEGPLLPPPTFSMLSEFEALRSGDGDPVALIAIDDERWLLSPRETLRLAYTRDEFALVGAFLSANETTIVWEGRRLDGPGMIVERWSSTGVRTLSRPLPRLNRGRWASSDVSRGRQDRRVVVNTARDGQSWIATLDLATLAVDFVTPEQPVLFLGATKDDALIMVLGGDLTQTAPSTVWRVDDSGPRKLMDAAPAGPWGSAVLHDARLYLVDRGEPGLWTLDVISGETSRWYRPDVLDASFQASCMSPQPPQGSSCRLVWASETRARFAVWPCSGGSCSIDVNEEAEARTLVFTNAQSEPEFVVASPNRRWDAWTRSAGGHHQTFLAAGDAPASAFQQVTFVLRPRFYLGFSRDERWIYNLLQDPRDGQWQIFRVSTETR